MARAYKPIDFLKLDEQLSKESQALVRELRKALHRLDARMVFAEAFKDRRFPIEIVSGLGGMDLFGITIPEKYGGIGASYENYGVACREL